MTLAHPILAPAIQHYLAGRLEEAQRACRKALRKRPDLAEGYLLLAEIHHLSGNPEGAREAAARALRLRPGWSEAHVVLGNVESAAGDHGPAESHYRAAIAAGGAPAGVLANHGHALRQLGRTEEALEAYRAALAREPDNPAFLLYVGTLLAELGQREEAFATLQRAVEIAPVSPDAEYATEQRVRLLQEERRFDEMDATCRAAMATFPRSAFFPHKLGVALWRRLRYEEALLAYRLAIERADKGSEAYRDAKFLEASGLLALARYREGWEAYRWRPVRARLRAQHHALIEDPCVLAAAAEPKRIRILAEQGLGDELFFLRFAGALQARGHAVFPLVPQKLGDLLEDQFDCSVDAPVDVTLASGDLPLASGLDFAQPLALQPESGRQSAWQARLGAFGPPPYIGVTWRAGLLPEEVKHEGLVWQKHVDAALLGATLRDVPGTVVVLQRKPAAGEISQLADALGRAPLDLSAVNDDLRDALAVLRLLDEYVGMSNTNMHLRAGLPGKLARVLVQTPAEWRWGTEGPSSPWFPGFRLYRQGVGRDWTDALAALRADLIAMQQK